MYLFNVLTILLHHFVLFFSILSQKEKFLGQNEQQCSVKLHDFFMDFMLDGRIFLKRQII